MAGWTDFERVWQKYREYQSRVRDAVSNDLPLRDKDRYLWGRSAARQLEHDIGAGFHKADAVPPNKTM